MHKKSTIILIICLCIAIIFSTAQFIKIENGKKMKAIYDGQEAYNALVYFRLQLREATELYNKDLLKGEVLSSHRLLLDQYTMISIQSAKKLNVVLSLFCIEQMHKENSFTQEDNDHYMEIVSFLDETLEALLNSDDIEEGKNQNYTYWSRVYSGLTSDEFIKKLDEVVNP